MKALTKLSCSLNLSEKPEIIRSMVSFPPKMELSCRMDCWSLHFFHFQSRLEILGQTLQLRPGTALLTPIHTHTISHYLGEHSLYFAHFMLPESGSERCFQASVLTDMEDEYATLDSTFEMVTRDFRVNPFKAEIGLWHILLSLFGPHGEEAQKKVPRKLSFAVSYIDQKLRELAGVEQVAKVAGISVRHLNRLFLDSFGVTVAGYIREKRMMMAKDYLQSSDYLVKEISAMVGAGSQQHFNNMIRARFGCSPLELRDNH